MIGAPIIFDYTMESVLDWISEELDMIVHFLRIHTFPDEKQPIEDFTNRADSWAAIDNASVFGARCNESEEIIVMGEDNAIFASSESKMFFVG